MGECVCCVWVREWVGGWVSVCVWVREWVCVWVVEGDVFTVRSSTVESVVVDLITEWIEVAALR